MDDEEEEIEKMVKDAEANKKESDKRKEESVDVEIKLIL